MLFDHRFILCSFDDRLNEWIVSFPKLPEREEITGSFGPFRSTPQRWIFRSVWPCCFFWLKSSGALRRFSYTTRWISFSCSRSGRKVKSNLSEWMKFWANAPLTNRFFRQTNPIGRSEKHRVFTLRLSIVWHHCRETALDFELAFIRESFKTFSANLNHSERLKITKNPTHFNFQINLKLILGLKI